MQNLEDRVKALRILVVGDIMLDKYVVGDVDRISPEAPVPIVKVSNEYSTLGGCGNVVRNLRELGAQTYCAASIADDDAGRKVLQALADIQAVPAFTWQARQTIVKERIIADQRKVQMLRIDREHIEPINDGQLIDEITIHAPTKRYFDIIVVSDYAKGVITWDLMEYLRDLETDIIIDPKPQNANLYGRPLMLTPNKKEWREMEIEDQCDAEFVLVTEGKDGMTLYDKRQGRGYYKIHSEPVEVYNVSGAGDSVVSIMAVCLALNHRPDRSAQIANACAGYVVTQPGTTVVPKNKFIESFRRYA